MKNKFVKRKFVQVVTFLFDVSLLPNKLLSSIFVLLNNTGLTKEYNSE